MAELNSINGTDDTWKGSFDTSVAAAGMTISGTTIASDGTDANIDITMTPKGTGTVNPSALSVNSAYDFPTADGNADEVLTTDGAGTTSWAAAGDVSAASNLTDFAVVRGADGAKGVQTSTVLISDDGEMTNPSQPAFLAYLSASATDVTGDSTSYEVVWDTEVFDQNSDFNTGTGIFTAPVTGRYQFSYIIRTNGYIAGHDNLFINPRVSNRTGINAIKVNPVVIMAATSSEVSLSGSLLYDMDAADTASIRVQAFNDTKVIDVLGGTNGSYYSGKLVC